MSAPPKIGFVCLGCPKALVDSERILTQLRAEGYDVVGTYEDADLVVVNTCGFIDDAVHESLDAIGEALARNGKVIVTGCLGARPETITDRHPSVLKVTGPHAYEEVVAAVHEQLPPLHDPFMDLVPPQGIRLTPRHYAYLKISEGCNHRCSFCIIPSMRGDLASRPIGEVMREAERLVKAGVKELLVISQDTSAYGVDLKYATGFWGGKPVKARFIDLARALGSLGAWVRLHYVYPYPHVDDVIPLMAEGKVLPYLDMPVPARQPASAEAHEAPGARREHARAHPRVARASARTSRSAARSSSASRARPSRISTMLLDWLREARLDRVGCFKYSPVEGAAANALPDPVPEEVKEERLDRFMELAAGDQRGEARREGRPQDARAGGHRGRGRRDRAFERRCAGDRRHRAHPEARQAQGRRLGRRRDHRGERLRPDGEAGPQQVTARCRQSICVVSSPSPRRSSFHCLHSARRPPVSEAIRERVDHLRYERGHDARDHQMRGANIVAADGVARFYEADQFQPRWQDPARLDQLIAAIADLQYDGLDPADYHVAALQSFRSDLRGGQSLAAGGPGRPRTAWRRTP